MGIIHVPRGIDTKRGYAPADVARSAAESEAPWAWRDTLVLFAFGQGAAFRNLIKGVHFSGDAPSTDFGLYGRRANFSSSDRLSAPDPQVTSIDEITVFAAFKTVGSTANRWILYRAPFLFREQSGSITFQVRDTTDFSGLVEASRSNYTNYRVVARCNSLGTHDIRMLNVDTGEVSGQTEQYTGSIKDGSGDILAFNHGSVDVGFVNPTYTAGFAYRRWTSSQVDEWLYDPFAPFRRRRIIVPVSSGGGTSVAVSGTSAAASAGVGALALDLGLAATAPGQSATVGALDAQPALAGDNDALSSLSGAMDRQPGLVGDSDSAAGLSGSIDAQPALAGSAASVSALSGALSILGDLLLSGQVQAQSTASGTASLLMGLAGEAAGTSGEDAMLSLVQALGGEASAQSGLTGALALTAEFLMSGSVQATSGASGDLAMELGLSGSSAGVSDLLGAAWLDLALSGQTTAAAQLQAVLAGITDDVGYLTADAITIRAALDGKPELRAALDAAVTIKPH